MVKVEPDTTVEVGELVLFDATATTDDGNLEHARFEWDFGDGWLLLLLFVAVPTRWRALSH